MVITDQILWKIILLLYCIWFLCSLWTRWSALSTVNKMICSFHCEQDNLLFPMWTRWSASVFFLMNISLHTISCGSSSVILISCFYIICVCTDIGASTPMAERQPRWPVIAVCVGLWQLSLTLPRQGRDRSGLSAYVQSNDLAEVNNRYHVTLDIYVLLLAVGHFEWWAFAFPPLLVRVCKYGQMWPLSSRTALPVTQLFNMI